MACFNLLTGSLIYSVQWCNLHIEVAIIKRRKFPQLFFGWWTVLATGIITFIGWGFINFSFSAFFKPIASELNFSRATTSIAPSIGSLERGALSPVAGWITDKFGPRWIILCGVLVTGLFLMLMYFVNSLWSFLLVWGLFIGTGSNVGFALPIEKAISNWFVRKRGRALSIRWTFMGMAAVLMLPVVAWLISTQGWRMTCVISGLIMWIIGLPLAWFFVKQHRPEYYGLLPDGATTEETLEVAQMIDQGVKYATEAEEIEFTLRQAMRTPSYWLVTLANAGFMVVPPVLVIHSMPFITDMGIEPVRAAVLIGMMSIGCIPGTFISAFIADRIKKRYLKYLIAGTYFLQLIGFAAFLLNQTMAMVYPLFILHHFSAGLFGPLTGVIIARYFGRKAFGSIRGTSMMFMLPASVLAPIYAGWVYDTTGSYINVFILCAALLAFSTILMSFASPPKPPVRVTDIRNIV